MQQSTNAQTLDAVDHVAVSVHRIAESVQWYQQHFRCRVRYQDETWAMLEFANTRLALIAEGRHPPHLGFVKADAEMFGTLQTHRDGSRFVYLEDPAGNTVEILAESQAS